MPNGNDFSMSPEERLQNLIRQRKQRAFQREARAFWLSESKRDREEREAEREKQSHIESGRITPDQKLAWIYARASHVDNSDTDSIPAQIERCKRRYQASWEERGYALARIEPDRITSASKIAFFNRTSGGIIGRLAKPGDVILVDKMDRIFRSLADFVITQQDLDKRGIFLEIGDCAFCSDPNNPFYRAMVVMMAMFAEMESRQKSIRIKDAFERRKQAGADINANVPYGIELVRSQRLGYGTKPLCFRQWNTWERSLMNAICKKADLEGFSQREVRDWLNFVVFRNKRIPADKTRRLSYPITDSMVMVMYWQEKMYRLYQISDVKQTREWEYHLGRFKRDWKALQSAGWLPLPE